MHSILQVVALVLIALAQTVVAKPAPAGCRKLNTDSDWPLPAAWKAVLPKVILRPANVKTGPDYRIRVESVEDVQKALKFANENNIRVSIIATGHDFMGRSTAASGLLIDVSLWKGIRVQESFVPTKEGVQGVTMGQKANVIIPKPNVQAAVTIGAGVLTQALNNALSPSKLFTLGAAHGKSSLTISCTFSNVTKARSLLLEAGVNSADTLHLVHNMAWVLISG
jgi:FAD/FMN-containing dehydrogenase